jgi:hypothetical protein
MATSARYRTSRRVCGVGTSRSADLTADVNRERRHGQWTARVSACVTEWPVPERLEGQGRYVCGFPHGRSLILVVLGEGMITATPMGQMSTETMSYRGDGTRRR